MARIQTQDDADALRSRPHDIYLDVVDDEFYFTAPAPGSLEPPQTAVVFRDNSEIYAQRFRSDSDDTDVDVGEGSTVRMAFITNGDVTGDIGFGTFAGNAASTAWRGGVLRGRNSHFVLDGASAYTAGNNLQLFPGNQTGNPYQLVIPGCTFRSGVDQIASATRPVIHMDGINPDAANDIDNVSFLNGQLIAPFYAFNWLGVTYSPDFAADSFTPVGMSYRRFGATTVGTDFNGFWYGDFACNFSNWTDNAMPANFDIRTALVGTNVASGNFVWYFIDGQYSDDWRNNGFFISTSSDGGAITSDLNFRSGRSWNPRFVETGTTVDVPDTIIDIGPSGTQYLFPTTSNTATDIPLLTASNTTRHIEWYVGGNPGGRRNGVIQIDNTLALGRNTSGRLTVREDSRGGLDTRSYNYWSYTHQCYDNRASLRAIGQVGRFTAPMQLSAENADLHTIELVSDLIERNNLDYDTAEARRTGGISSLDDVYAVLKADGYNERSTNFPIVVEGEALNFGVQAVQFVAAATNNSAYGSATSNLALTAGGAISGGTLYNTIRTTGNISAGDGTTIDNITLETTGTIDFTNIALGTNNITLRDATLSNLILTGQTLTLDGNIRLAARPVDGVYDWSNITIPAGATVTIPGLPASDVEISGLTAEEQARVSGASRFTQAAVTNTISIPRLIGGAIVNGRYAITARKSTLAADQEIVLVPPTDMQGSGTQFSTPITYTVSSATSPDGANFSDFVSGGVVNIYVKYDSAPGTIRVYDHLYTQVAFGPDGTTLSPSGDGVLPATLVEQAQRPTIAGWEIEETPTSNTDAIVQLRNTVADTILSLNNPATLYASILIGNTDRVFDGWYNNRNTTVDSPLTYLQANTVRFNGDIVTIQSGNRGTTPAFDQHTVQGWEGTGIFRVTNGIAEIIDQPVNLASIPVSLISAGIDASNTGASVEDMVNYAGYRATNPLLNGPNGGAINNGTDYRGNIRRTNQ